MPKADVVEAVAGPSLCAGGSPRFRFRGSAVLFWARLAEGGKQPSFGMVSKSDTTVLNDRGIGVFRTEDLRGHASWRGMQWGSVLVFSERLQVPCCV